MTAHRLHIVQVFEVVRSIVVTVEAPTLRDAIDAVTGGEAPPYDHPDWIELRTLRSEQVVPWA
jgi:hypothetical protein